MKPGRGTIQTLATGILEYETSKKADRNRVYRKLATKLEFSDTALIFASNLNGILKSVAQDAIVHRELRRMARRLAKMAVKQEVDLAVERRLSELLKKQIDRLSLDVRSKAERIEALEAELKDCLGPRSV